MNIVEFALKFKDLASSELRKFGQQAKTTFDSAKKQTDGLTGNNRLLARSYDDIQKRIQEVESTLRNSKIPSEIRNARRELEALKRESSGSMAGKALGGGGGMMDAAGLLGLGKFAGPAAVAAVGYKVGEWLGDAISASLERQKILTSFNVLAGSEQAGSALSKQLISLQKDTILGPEVFKNAQTMMGFGIKSGEVYDNLKMLGDVSMGDAERLNMLTLAFSQVRAAGKLQGQDLLQLINAGYNPLEDISKRTGKTMGQLKDEMSKGNISFSMVQQAFRDATGEGGKFNNMLNKLAETPAGKMEQFKGQWEEFKINAGTAFMPLISMALDFASSMMPLIEGLIKPLSSGIQMAANWMKSLTKESGGLMDYVSIIKNVFVYGILPAGQKLFGFIFSTVGKLMEFISHSKLLKDVFMTIGIIVSNLWGFIGLIVDALTVIVDTVVMPILKALEWVYRKLTGGGFETMVKVKQPVGKSLNESTNTDLLNTIAQNTAENTNATKSTEKAITGGGPKVINITVQKFLDAININSTTLEAGVTDIEGKILEMFARVVSQGAAAI